ncbi:MAG: hypothetical protein VB112_00135 [Oscillospiraceae bacterium]|nr:hypothetical protein [Oscillospiraceae bacterium]
MKRYVDKGEGGAVVFLLSLCFLFGIFAGRGAALYAYDAAGASAASYIASFVDRRSGEYPAALSVFGYFRYPTAAFLLGFIPFGAVLIPSALFLEAFSLSFAVNLFTLSLSEYGLFLALASIGFRYLFVLPCLFYISALSLRRSLVRAGMLRRENVSRGTASALIICAAVLFIGVVVERVALPTLLSYLSSFFT